MRKTTYLERAVLTGILIVMAILLLALYPFRKFRREVVLPRDDFPVGTMLTVNEKTTVVQRFTTEFEDVKAIEIYVQSLDGGRYMQIHVNDIYGPERANRYIDLAEEKLPGYVRVPLDIKIPTDTYEMIVIDAIRASFRLQTEDVAAVPQEWDQMLREKGEDLPGLHLRMNVIYDLPVDGKTTLLYGVVVILCALLLSLAVRFFFRKFPEKNRLIVVRDAWKRVIQILSAVFFAVLFVLNFPLKSFDGYASEILFYAAGIVMAAGITFYVIHRLFGDLSVEIRPEWRSRIMSAFLALAIDHAVDYVNGFYDIHHALSMRRLVICLFVMLVIACFPRHLLHPLSLVYTVAAIAASLWYLKGHLMPDTESFYVTQNELVRLQAGMMAVLGYIILLLLLHARESLRRRPEGERLRLLTDAVQRITPYGILSVLTALAMMLFANGRLWLFNMVILYVLLYAGISAFGLKERWFQIFSEGVMMHFLASLVFCLLHRAYQFWVFMRFPFVFTTVTVTGEYLVMVLAVAAVRLALKLQKLPGGTKWRDCFRAAALEIFFFGTVSAYLIITITRLAWASAFGMLVVALFLAGRRNRLRTAVIMVFSAMLLFVPVFTMQRIVPSLVSDHRFVGDWEETVTFGGVRGTVPSDSPFYMRFGRFVDMIGLRLKGESDGYRMRLVDPMNYDADGNPLYDHDGSVLTQEMREAAEAAAAQETEEIQTTEEEETVEEEEAGFDITNGRLSIWKSYLAECNATGHEGEENENTVGGHAHNTYIQAMFDHGIPVGILFSLWIGITILTGALRYRKTKNSMACLQTVLVAGYACISVAEWTFHPGNPAAMMFLAGIATLMTKEKETA